MATAAALAAVLLLTGCAKLGWQESNEVDRQWEAGSTHVSVVAVAPWDDVADILQPGFNVSAEKALDMVLPNTASFSEQSIDALNLAFKLGLYKGSSQASDSNASGASQGSKPPDLNKAEALKQDPILKHLAAAGLFQEIQFLNNYLSHRPRSKSHEAFLVRLQVSLMPRRRNLPYDAHLMLSFFDGGDPGQTKCEAGSDLRACCDSKMGQGEANPADMVVVPIMLADQLETALLNSARERQRGWDVGLSTGLPGVEGEASVGAQRNKASVKGASAQDMNSIMTVGRLSENTIHVRLGAYHLAEDTYSMVPRSHFVNLLLLVPRKTLLAGEETISQPARYAHRVKLIHKAFFIHSTKGTDLSRNLSDVPEGGLDLVLRMFFKDKELKKITGDGDPAAKKQIETTINKLTDSILMNNFACFSNYADELAGMNGNSHPWTSSEKQQLWSELSHQIVGLKSSICSFEVSDTLWDGKKGRNKGWKAAGSGAGEPGREAGQSGIDDETAWLLDDGKHITTTISVTKATALRGAKLKEQVKNIGGQLSVIDHAKDNASLYLKAEGIKVVGEDKVQLTFGSMAAFGFGESILRNNMRLHLQVGRSAPALFDCLYRRAPAPAATADSKLKVAANVGDIVAEGKSGSLALQLTLAEGTDKAVLQIENAQLQGTQKELGETAEMSNHKEIKVKKSGSVILSLMNLNPKKKVTVTPKVDGQLANLPLEFNVIAGGSPTKP